MIGRVVKRGLTYWSDRRATEQERAARAWLRAGYDRTLRLEYDLEPSSVVLDLGGFEGQWTSDIYAKYRCKIHVFEPVERFARGIELRFARNPDIAVHRFALGSSSGMTTIAIDQDRSSLFGRTASREGVEVIELVEAKSWFDVNGVSDIALMKINIEGAEYDLLDHLLEAQAVTRVRDLQVQFHEFVPFAAERMERIQQGLAKTHERTYAVRFVWENWHRIEAR